MNIKYGNDVKTSADLQNLVTSVILRQTNPFTVDSVYNEVSQKLAGSVFANDKEVRDRCEWTIDRLFSIRRLNITENNKCELAMGWQAINRR